MPLPGKIAPPPRTVAMPLPKVMRLKRAHFDYGGAAPFASASDLGERIHTGPIKSQVKGRTDHIPLTVPAGSFVVPADVISGMGQGNSDAGHLELTKRFNLTPGTNTYARGGGVKILAAGGEHVIAPHDVRRHGGGDIDKGHAKFDKFVVEERKKIIKTMKKLPGPTK
jgi:hypothetical protein